MIELTNPAHFNLRTIMNSGQCFRIFEPEHNVFDVLAMDCWVRVFYDENTNTYAFDCSEVEFLWWKYYFDLNTDYQLFFDSIADSGDAFLKEAAAYSDGMRILHQAYWEVVLSFIISQNNNIPRIKKSIEALCKKFGKPITRYGVTYYSFPTVAELSQIRLEDLSDLGLGYRDKYICGICQDPSLVRELDKLLDVPGIGPKVASCIKLFGCHDLRQCPIDTWMKKLLREIYNDNFDFTPYHGFEGFIQQLQFYYYRSLKLAT